MFNFLKNLFYKNTKPALLFQKIVAAKVLTTQKHPNADRLKLVTLDIGSSVVGPVVCGATNFEVGNIVALALPGAKISKSIRDTKFEPYVLEKATIRGIESQGMICAGFELGLSDQPEQGIILLKNTAILGGNFSEEMIQ